MPNEKNIFRMKKLLVLIISIVSMGLLPLLLSGYAYKNIDFVNQQIPFIIETKRLLSSGKPWWSWNTFLGDNFIGSYSFYTITSPFVWFVCLFQNQHILVGIIIALYLKFIATGASAYAYFRYIGVEKDKCTVGGLCYVFSAFFITNLFYYHFCEPIMVFPLLLIAIESVFKNEKYAVAILSLISFLVVFINFYFALSSFILGIAYFFSRYISSYQSLKAERRHYTIVLQMLAGGIVGLALSSFVLVPTVMHVGGSGRSTLNLWVSYLSETIAHSLEILRQFVMPRIIEGYDGSFSYSGWNSNLFFIPVVGAMPLLLIISKWQELSNWAKTGWISWLTLTLFIIAFTPLNRLFTGCTSIFYTRWFYGLVLFFIVAFINSSLKIR